MSVYRNISFAAFVATAPISAAAGGLAPTAESVVIPAGPIVVEQPKARSSAQGLIIPAILIALVAIAAGSDIGSGT